MPLHGHAASCSGTELTECFGRPIGVPAGQCRAVNSVWSCDPLHTHTTGTGLPNHAARDATPPDSATYKQREQTLRVARRRQSLATRCSKSLRHGKTCIAPSRVASSPWSRQPSVTSANRDSVTQVGNVTDHHNQPADTSSLSESASTPCRKCAGNEPPDLALIVARWHELPEAVKAGIRAIVEAAVTTPR